MILCKSALYVRRSIFRILLFSIMLFNTPGWAGQEPVDYVDPMIGTSKARWMHFPGATLPFGMVELSPDNVEKTDLDAGYEYTMNTIAGFGHLHSYGFGGGLMMPIVGDLQTQPGTEADPDAGYRSRFRHSTEVAKAGYYAVTLDDYHIRAEMTATMRCGLQRYTFPAAEKAYLLFDLNTPEGSIVRIVRVHLRRINDREIEGTLVRDDHNWNQYRLNFVMQVNKPFAALGGWNGRTIEEDVQEWSGEENADVGVFLRFATRAGESLLVRTGFSLVSIAQARLNLETEMAPFGWDFAAVRSNARRVWNDLLSLIKVEGGREQDRIKFYTNLYRAYCGKSVWSDVNGQWLDMCENLHLPDGAPAPMYGGDVVWGTHWNLNQLWALVTPDIMNEWIAGMQKLSDAGGWFPKGPSGLEYSGIMTGVPQIPFVVGAFQKGIRNYDVNRVYAALLKLVTVPGFKHECSGLVGNPLLQPYLEYGYIPSEFGPVSVTLEAAYQDWCLSQMAAALGYEQDHQTYLLRSQSYKNIYDADVGYMRPKYAGGPWLQQFDPVEKAVGYDDNFGEKKYYVEGNAWQYTWFVPHDLAGLIDLLGEAEFNDRLQYGFEHSGPILVSEYVNQANQPNMQASWLFNYSGKPWLTQYWTREILDRYYGLEPVGGCPGDEDEGQMGAWYVMAGIGLFEMDGGASQNPIYEIASPLFDRITIQLDQRYYSGKSFCIETRNNSSRNRYIQSATLDGKPLTRPWFYHRELVDGGTLILHMGDKPNYHWGSRKQDRPQQEAAAPVMTAPYVKSTEKYFLQETEIRLACDTPGAEIRYTLDDAEAIASARIYTAPFKVDRTVPLRMQAFKQGCAPSLEVKTVLHKAELLKPAQVETLVQGLRYVYYTGTFEGDIGEVAGITKLARADSGIAPAFEITVASQPEYYGLIFSGYVEVPGDGIYTFSTKSNDGSRLYVHDRMVVNNDGMHWPKEEYGSIALAKGVHPLRLEFFQAGGGSFLAVFWQGPDLEKQELTGDRLFADN